MGWCFFSVENVKKICHFYIYIYLHIDIHTCIYFCMHIASCVRAMRNVPKEWCHGHFWILGPFVYGAWVNLSNCSSEKKMKKKESKHHDTKKNNNHLRDGQNEPTQKWNSVRGFAFGVLASLPFWLDFTGFWSNNGSIFPPEDYFRCGTFSPVAHVLSGQIIMFHQPRFPSYKGISLTKPSFGVRSCESL